MVKTRDIQIINTDEIYAYGKIKIDGTWLGKTWIKEELLKFAKNTNEVQTINKRKLERAEF